MNHAPSVGDTVWLLRPGDDEPVQVRVEDVDRSGRFVTTLSDKRVRYAYPCDLYATRLDALEAASAQAVKVREAQ